MEPLQDHLTRARTGTADKHLGLLSPLGLIAGGDVFYKTGDAVFGHQGDDTASPACSGQPGPRYARHLARAARTRLSSSGQLIS